MRHKSTGVTASKGKNLLNPNANDDDDDAAEMHLPCIKHLKYSTRVNDILVSRVFLW